MVDVPGYLRRLGIVDPGPPDLDGLFRLNAAHVERVAYEALDIQLARPTSIEPADSVERIVGRGRGGYCYHLNGAFSLLLDALGYRARRHRGGVQTSTHPGPPGPIGNHMALTVSGLPSADNPAGEWLVDVGLGDGPHLPLPLRAGEYAQGPFRYRIRASDVIAGGWRFDHDARGSFVGMDFPPGPADIGEFAERHHHLSTSPESSFVRTCCVMRRDGGGLDVLTGRVLRRLDTDNRARTLDTQGEWFDVLADVFGLPLTDLDAAARDALWTRVGRAHERYLSESSSQ